MSKDGRNRTHICAFSLTETILFLVIDSKCIDAKCLKLLLIQFRCFLSFLFYNSAIIVLLFVIEDEHQQAVVGQDENAPVSHLLTGWPKVNYWGSLVKTWHRLTADQTSVWEPRVICIYTNSKVICEAGWCSGAWSPLGPYRSQIIGCFLLTTELRSSVRQNIWEQKNNSCSSMELYCGNYFETSSPQVGLNSNSWPKTDPFMVQLSWC